MASRYIRDTVIFVKSEVSYGVDPVPTGAANTMAISNVRITPLDAQYVPRDLIRGWFGASEELIAQYNKAISFDIEAVGSGTAGTAPAWGPVLRACGWAETLTVTERATYKPITNSQESVTIYVYDAGVLHKLLGARGGVTIGMGLGGIPKLSFTLLGIDGGDTAATPSGAVYTAFQAPQVVNNQFTGSLTLGGTLTSPGVAPSITAGTVYPSRGLMVDMGIKASYIGLLDGESVEITDRKASGRITIDVTAAQEVTFYGTVTAGTLQSVALLHGSSTGKKFGVFAPKAQLKNPQKDEVEGKRLMTYDLVLCPDAGNDEVTIVTSW